MPYNSGCLPGGRSGGRHLLLKRRRRRRRRTRFIANARLASLHYVVEGGSGLVTTAADAYLYARTSAAAATAAATQRHPTHPHRRPGPDARWRIPCRGCTRHSHAHATHARFGGSCRKHRDQLLRPQPHLLPIARPALHRSLCVARLRCPSRLPALADCAPSTTFHEC